MAETRPVRVADAERRLRRWIERALPSWRALADVPLRPVSERPPGSGTTPSALFEDPHGGRVLFRAMRRDEIAAEELARTVRALAGRPHLPIARRVLELSPGRPREGMVRPYLADAAPLSRDPDAWTPLDARYLLREHPWEWLLANLDTHPGQYLSVGPDRLPVNIDWDRSLADLHVVRLGRFTRRASVLIPARNRLYDAYVRGQRELRFGGLWEQVARAESLPRRALADAVLAYAEVAERPDGDRLVDRVLARQAALPDEFAALVAGLRDERFRWARSTGGRVPGLRLTFAHLRDRATRLALTEPPPVMTRGLLAAWSAFRRVRALVAGAA